MRDRVHAVERHGRRVDVLDLESGGPQDGDADQVAMQGVDDPVLVRIDVDGRRLRRAGRRGRRRRRRQGRGADGERLLGEEGVADAIGQGGARLAADVDHAAGGQRLAGLHLVELGEVGDRELQIGSGGGVLREDGARELRQDGAEHGQGRGIRQPRPHRAWAEVGRRVRGVLPIGLTSEIRRRSGPDARAGEVEEGPHVLRSACISGMDPGKAGSTVRTAGLTVPEFPLLSESPAMTSPWPGSPLAGWLMPKYRVSVDRVVRDADVLDIEARHRDVRVRAGGSSAGGV